MVEIIFQIILTNLLIIIIFILITLYDQQAEPPVYWTVKEWCDGLKKLLDYMGFEKVHLFGASLGNFIIYFQIHMHMKKKKNLQRHDLLLFFSFFKVVFLLKNLLN